MLFVHGSVSSGRMWRRISGFIEGPHEMPDLIGAVGTPVVLLPENVVEADLAILEAALERLAQPTTVVGHSYGGFLALQLALRHPEKVKAVVAHEPVCWRILEQHGPDGAWEELESQLTKDGLNDLADLGSPRWIRAFLEFWNGPRGWLGLPSQAQQTILQSRLKTAAEVAYLFADRTLVEGLNNIACPVRLTRGAQGHPAEREVVGLLANLLPDGAVAEVDGAHLAPISHPRQVFEVWEPWLKALA